METDSNCADWDCLEEHPIDWLVDDDDDDDEDDEDDEDDDDEDEDDEDVRKSSLKQVASFCFDGNLSNRIDLALSYKLSTQY